MQEDKTPKIKDKRVLFESKKFKIVQKDMEFANGAAETWETVELKGLGGARVLAITENKELIFIKEYRGAAEKHVLRFPTGLIEEGEDPIKAAARELQEETGFAAQKLEPLGILESTSGYYKGSPLHIFVGIQAKQVGNMAREPAEEDMEMLFIPLKKAFYMAQQVQIEDTQTVYTILMLKKHLSAKKEGLLEE